ncbi:MAG: hypothetical protein HY252_11530 [Sphingobacteriales bacterium]|nr:hypothetical protein [Sphingobacteriales bacterium]
MKTSILFLLPAVMLFSCKKNNDNIDPSAATLVGKWVNVAGQLDTLDVYKEGDKIIMFDNSFYFRTNMAAWTNYNAFKKEVGSISNETIYTRPYKSNDVYFDNYFKWLNPYTKFEIRVQALHPEVSALYNITYEKVQ